MESPIRQNTGNEELTSLQNLPSTPPINNGKSLHVTLLFIGLIILTVSIISMFFLRSQRQELNSRKIKIINPVVVGEKPTPTEIIAIEAFPKRQFDVNQVFFGDKPYPSEISTEDQKNLIGMKCTPLFICNTKDCTFTFEKYNIIANITPEATPGKTGDKLTDPLLIKYWQQANELIKSYNSGYKGSLFLDMFRVCNTEDKRTIIEFETQLWRGIGKGTATAAYFGTIGADGMINKIVEIIKELPPNTTFFCIKPIQLTKKDILYYKCEGTEIKDIYKIDLNSKIIIPVLQCKTGRGVIVCN